MMNVISSMSTLPTQTIPLEVPAGTAIVVALAVVVAIAFADQGRALFSSLRRSTRTGLRLVHSN